MSGRQWFASIVLLLAIVATGGGLAVWKERSIAEANAAAARMPEPMESITVAKATARQYRRSTTAIGTVRALASITLSNEIAGTVRQIALPPGQVVEADTLLVALDVSVEEAERKAQQAQLALAQSVVGRMEKAALNHGASDLDVDKAHAERDVAAAQIARTEAVIARLKPVLEDPEFAHLVDVWPTLPEAMRRGILAMVGSLAPLKNRTSGRLSSHGNDGREL
jgi:membrane fusion protein (multidrug efflux system)